MGRMLKTAAGMINIALHPHSDQIYAEFLRGLFQLKVAIKVRGERYGVLSLLDRKTKDDCLSGIITTFTHVDKNSSWFDISTLQEASSLQTESIVIPKGLYPNPKSFHFVFDLKRHTLYFQHYSEGDVLTPGSAERIFRSLSENPSIIKNFGKAKISIVQSKRGLERIFAIPVIKEITIRILRPNPDVFSSQFDKKIAEHLEETRSRELELKYRAEPGQSIKPDDDIRLVSQYSLSSGSTSVKGRDADGAVSLSTDKFPEILTGKYDSEEESDPQAFRRLVSKRRGK